MSFKVTDDCIGCGACEFACPTGALSKTDSFLGVFVIDPYLCDDCALCVDKCPVMVIVPDPVWPVCHGRGCPLTSSSTGRRRLRRVAAALPRVRHHAVASRRRGVGLPALRAGAAGPMPQDPQPRYGRPRGASGGDPGGTRPLPEEGGHLAVDS